jgi:thymidylate kinase
MRATRLILLEGVPGSGKSTTAHFLHRHLARLGVPHRWWYEGERGHPLYVFEDAASLNQTVDDIFSQKPERVQRIVGGTLTKWRELAAALEQSGEVALLDGMLYGHLTWTLFPAGVPNDVTMAYVAEAERAIHPLSPCVIYFRPDDVAGAMRRIAARRGREWAERAVRQHTLSPYGRRRGLQGFDGLVAFWEDYRDLADTLFTRSPLAKCCIPTDAGDWPAYLQRVCAFLGLPAADGAEPRPNSALERFAGTYDFTHRGERRRCQVTYEGGALYLTGVPDVWPRTRLIPLETIDEGGASFAAESLPFEFTFLEDAARGVREMRAAGPDFVWGSIPRAFAKREE